MRFVCASAVGRSVANCRAAGDKRWLIRLLGKSDGLINAVRIMTIAMVCVPSSRLKSLLLIFTA